MSKELIAKLNTLNPYMDGTTLIFPSNDSYGPKKVEETLVALGVGSLFSTKTDNHNTNKLSNRSSISALANQGLEFEGAENFRTGRNRQGGASKGGLS